MKTQLDLLDRDWINQNAPLVLQHFAHGQAFTADDLHDLLPEPVEKNHFGALVARLKPHLERIGYQPSKRADRNGGLVCVWRIKDSTTTQAV